MSEKREYEDYEELGRNIREAYQSLHDIDLHKANETLRAAVTKAASMWGDEDPQMLVAVSRLRSLQQLELQSYIECPELRSPEDTATTARKRLNELRYMFHKAFLTDVGRHQAFLAKVEVLRIPTAYIYSPFFSEEKLDDVATLPYREHKPGLLDHGSFHASMSPRKGDARSPVSEKNSSRHLSG